MVFRNTPANKWLARKLAMAVRKQPGFTPIVDLKWNCGEDIRFEIGTSYALHCPFTVQTFCTDAGYFGIKVRMRKTELDATEVIELKNWMTDLESITAEFTELIAEAKPQRSKYAF